MRQGGWRIRALILGLMLAPWVCAADSAHEWTLIDIGTFGGPGSYATAVSGNGLVVGCADLATGGTHAFIYDGATLRDLGPGSAQASGNSCALAVNNAGLVAGRSTTGDLVIWDGSSVISIGKQGAIGAMNDRGVVVGAYKDGENTRAFSFENGTLTALVVSPEGGSSATDINTRGQIVGAANGRAFLYENGVAKVLGTLGGNRSIAKSINDSGKVVGMSTDGNGQPRPFLYEGAMRALPGPAYSSANAINNPNQVVGSAEGTYGYLLEGNTYTRLDTLPAVIQKGWRHLEPAGLNDRGWIVGTGMNPDGDLRAFILRPTDRAFAYNGLQRPQAQPVAAIARSLR